MDVLVRDLPLQPGEGQRSRAIPDLDGSVQELEDPLRSHQPRLNQSRELAQVLHRGVELHAQAQEDDELLPAQLPSYQHQVSSVPKEDHRADGGQHLRDGCRQRPEALGPDEGLEVALSQAVETMTLVWLCRGGFHQPDSGQRLLDVGVHLTGQIQDFSVTLSQLPDQRAPHHHRGRNHHEGRQRELERDCHHEHNGSGKLEDRGDDLAQLLRQKGAELLHVVGEAGDDLAHLRPAEEGQVQLQEVVVDLIPKIPGDPLLDPGHQVGPDEIEDVLDRKDHQDEEDDAPDGHLRIGIQIHDPTQRPVQEALQEALILPCRCSLPTHTNVARRGSRAIRRIRHSTEDGA